MLNEPQAEAVAHASGPLLVFAGAGSGKTRVITYRVANLLAEHEVPPYRILAVTFTNKAAAEMRERLEKLATPEIAHDLWVGTFHATCARLLRRYHAEVGLTRHFVIYDDSDQKAIMSRLIKQAGYDDKIYPAKQVLSRIHHHKREARSPRDIQVSPAFDEIMVDLYERYEAALKAASACDFEDLILHVMRIAEDTESTAGAELRKRFDYVLVDEFQDTNRVQYRLVRALAASSRNLCVVGDDDQSIYSWRGADIRNIRGFKSDFPDAKVVKLEQNYRSTSNIVRAALGVIEPSRQREPKKLWTAHAPGDKVKVKALRDERDEALHVVDTIQRELGGGVVANEIAVFYRVHAQSRVLEESLRAEKVAYQIVGGIRFFDRAEVKDLLAYLRLIDNPRSDADLMRIINTPTRGLGQKTVNQLFALAAERGSCGYDALEPAQQSRSFSTAPKKRLAAFKALLDELRDDATRCGPRELAEQVLVKSGYRQLLKDQDSPEADARLENLEEVLGSLAEFELDVAEAGDEPTLEAYLERVALISDVDQMEDTPKVSLMTVHAAKGLEFETVLLTGMEEEIFPYRGLDGANPEELEEERRLAYVAVTRARQRLFLSHVGTRMLFGKTRFLVPSRFLSDLPEETVSREGNAWAARGMRAPPSSRGPFSRGPQQYGGRRGFGGGPGAGYGRRPSRSSYASDGFDAPSQRRGDVDIELEPGERYVDRDAFDDVPDRTSQLRIQPGDSVFHQRFGRGIVESVEHGDSPRVVAKFRGFGVRKVLAEKLRFG